jgi:hypothetical protein
MKIMNFSNCYVLLQWSKVLLYHINIGKFNKDHKRCKIKRTVMKRKETWAWEPLAVSNGALADWKAAVANKSISGTASGPAFGIAVDIDVMSTRSSIKLGPKRSTWSEVAFAVPVACGRLMQVKYPTKNGGCCQIKYFYENFPTLFTIPITGQFYSTLK